MRNLGISIAAMIAAAIPASALAQSSASPTPAYFNYTANVGGTFGNNDPIAYPPLFNDLYTFTTSYARNATIDITSDMATRVGGTGTCSGANPAACDFTTNVNFVSNGVRLQGHVVPVVSTGVHEERYLANFRIPAGMQQIVVRGSSAANGSYLGLLTLSGVPEPATWALMIMGFGFTGAAMRRRREQTVATFA